MKDMEYGSNVCKWMLKRFRLESETDKVEFWLAIRSRVKEKINYLRNSVIAGIKDELMGK